jgi:REP-associated tyrosine transposase
MLDRHPSGPRWLQTPVIADLVARAMLHGESSRQFYHLYAWVVMPNHVHMLILPTVPTADITRWLKGSTAREANKILNRTRSPFWQDESYDHYLRNANQMNRTIAYIEQNPVSAGLVDSIDHWPWSSAGWQAEAPAPPRPNQYPIQR